MSLSNIDFQTINWSEIVTIHPGETTWQTQQIPGLRSEEIKLEHLAETIHFPSLDREGWAG